jgi:hypothetical protein
MIPFLKRHNKAVPDNNPHPLSQLLAGLLNRCKVTVVSYCALKEAGISGGRKKLFLFLFGLIAGTFFLYLIIVSVTGKMPDSKVDRQSVVLPVPIGDSTKPDYRNRH